MLRNNQIFFVFHLNSITPITLFPTILFSLSTLSSPHSFVFYFFGRLPALSALRPPFPTPRPTPRGYRIPRLPYTTHTRSMAQPATDEEVYTVIVVGGEHTVSLYQRVLYPADSSLQVFTNSVSIHIRRMWVDTVLHYRDLQYVVHTYSNPSS